MGASTDPKRFNGGAGAEVFEPKLEKIEVAGGLPAGVLDAAGVVEIEKNPAAAGAGAEAGAAGLPDP